MFRKSRYLRRRYAPAHIISFALTLVLALTAVLTPAATSKAQGQVTIRVWGYGLDDARAKARVAVFQQANPNITIESVGGELNTQQLLTAVASGDPPEVVNVDRAQTGSWAGRNAIDPLDDLIARDNFDLAQ